MVSCLYVKIEKKIFLNIKRKVMVRRIPVDCNTVAVGLRNGWLLFAGAPADSNKGHVYICVVRQLFLSVTGEIKVTIQRRTLHLPQSP